MANSSEDPSTKGPLAWGEAASNAPPPASGSGWWMYPSGGLAKGPR